MKFIDGIYNIISDYLYCINNKENRNKLINNLNIVFFYDNIAKFIDMSSDEDVDMNRLSLVIKYNDILYSVLEFEKIYLKIDRMRKLKNLNEYTNNK